MKKNIMTVIENPEAVPGKMNPPLKTELTEHPKQDHQIKTVARTNAGKYEQAAVRSAVTGQMTACFAVPIAAIHLAAVPAAEKVPPGTELGSSLRFPYPRYSAGSHWTESFLLKSRIPVSQVASATEYSEFVTD